MARHILSVLGGPTHRSISDHLGNTLFRKADVTTDVFVSCSGDRLRRDEQALLALAIKAA